MAQARPSQMSPQDVASKEEHLKLAGIVKGVHAKLRSSLRQSAGDYEAVWQAHCQNRELLGEYADAMRHLATEYWSKRPETRIHWCRTTCLEYFHGGGLEKALAKDARRHQFDSSQSQEAAVAKSDSEGTTGSEDNAEAAPLYVGLGSLEEEGKAFRNVLSKMQNGEASCDVGVMEDFGEGGQSDGPWDGQSSSSSQPGTDSELLFGSPEQSLEERRESVYARYPKPIYSAVALPFEGPIRLLDVGSCYNAFVQFEEFQAIGVDISPAVESVHQCDILSVELTEPLQLARDSMATYFNSLPKKVNQLPRGSFHTIVFSLLLEYFPARYQRWLCCQRAHQLLALHGLLLIVTPDSHAVHKNAAMMRSWRTAIEAMGFKRWRYLKQEHLHCLAFRKTSPELLTGPVGEAGPDLMYIPQDLHEEEEDHTQSLFGSAPLSDCCEDYMKECFSELPDCVD